MKKKHKKSAIKYVEDFYAIINNEEEFKKYLGETCDYLHTSTRHLTNMK